MKTVLVITDNCQYKETIDTCIFMEDNGWKCFIEMDDSDYWERLLVDVETSNWSWIILAFDDYTKYQALLKNLDFKLFLSNNIIPLKAIIREPWELISDYLDLGFDVYSDWLNFKLRNFLV